MIELAIHTGVPPEIVGVISYVALVLNLWGIPCTVMDTSTASLNNSTGDLFIITLWDDPENPNLRASINCYSYMPYCQIFLNPSSCQGNGVYYNNDTNMWEPRGCPPVDWFVAIIHEVCHKYFDADACPGCNYREQVRYYRVNLQSVFHEEPAWIVTMDVLPNYFGPTETPDAWIRISGANTTETDTIGPTWATGTHTNSEVDVVIVLLVFGGLVVFAYILAKFIEAAIRGGKNGPD